MILIILTVLLGSANASDIAPKEDLLECSVPADGEEMQCSASQHDYAWSDTCGETSCPMARAAHVHVEPVTTSVVHTEHAWYEDEIAEPERTEPAVADNRVETVEVREPQRQRTEQVETRTVESRQRPQVAVSVRGGTRRGAYGTTTRPPGVQVSGGYVSTAPLYGGNYVVVPQQHTVYQEQATMTALDGMRAYDTWVAEARASEQAVRNEADARVAEAEEREREAERARKAAESRQLIAEAEAKQAQQTIETQNAQLDEAEEVIEGLLEENP